MRVLLTGATGFLGSHILHRLGREDVQVAAIVRPEADRWRIQEPPGNATLIEGDLRNIVPVLPRLAEFEPEVIIHTAWSGVGNKYRHETLQIDQNLMSSVDLLRYAADIGCQHFIGLGSQAEYGPLNRKISETEFPHPTTLYGAAKLATAILLQQLAQQLGVRFAWLRVFSTYGPREDPAWMLPYLIRSLLKGERPALTPCEQNWDYLFAPDAAEAIWAVARHPEAKGVFNLGSGQVYTLRRIVETIRDMIDPKLPVGFGEVPYRPDQVMHLEADITRLQQATGWTPAHSIELGLRETIRWHGAQLKEQHG